MVNPTELVDISASGSETSGAFALTCTKVSAWEHVADTLRARAAQSLRDRNALLPVHQLPVEVLTDIPEEAVDGEFDPYLQRLKKLKQFSHVCHCWQKAIDGSPWLWARIQGNDSPRLVTEALMKSSNCLLEFSFFTRLSSKPDNLAAFLGKLDPHLDRLRSVEISFLSYQIPDGRFTTIKLLTTPQPSLERFFLCDESSQTDLSELALFAGQAPRLKDLQLRGLRVNCRGALFGGLSSLSLSDVTVPSLKDLLGTIGNCRYLLYLGLKHIWFQDIETDPPPDRISLPVLQRLSLSDMHLTLTERFLRDIHAPQSAWFSLSLHVDSEDLITTVDIKIMENRLFLTFHDPKHSEPSRLNLSHDKSVGLSRAVLTGINAILKSRTPKADVHLTLGDTALHLVEDGSYVEQLRRLSQVTMLQLGETWRYWSCDYWESDGAQNFHLPATAKCVALPTAIGMDHQSCQDVLRSPRNEV
ncbi:hypothetical protein M407DRAFT_27929 [Tulasnella calospora MUT 4182]|uniref:F-box domain-containing protein n=1 Tax=Tulasnella calospora MUT 4182 TaxID=1051891 RepID=A0A0C3Q297_9AGAM|nr:hypothetical protein M407DRAFT_27929 [Tulasnella calospora MUT 4182]